MVAVSPSSTPSPSGSSLSSRGLSVVTTAHSSPSIKTDGLKDVVDGKQDQHGDMDPAMDVLQNDGDVTEETQEMADQLDGKAEYPEVVTPTTQLQRRRKRDVVRQISMRLYLKGKDIAEDVLRNVAPQRLEDTESVCCGTSGQSSLEHEIAPSRKTRKHLWLPQTQDDSVLMTSSKTKTQSQSSQSSQSPQSPRELRDLNAFFLSRVTDPTSYFYRFHFDDTVRHLAPQRAEVQLVDIQWLKPHEEIVSRERVSGLKKATLSWDAYTEPLLVDIKSGAILDGHHRFTVATQLRLKQVPCVLVDYLGDHTITVDVWPGCGRNALTKEQVIEMALSPNVFPPKTSRHRFTESLPPISIPLSVLRQNATPIQELTISVTSSTTPTTKRTKSPASKQQPSSGGNTDESSEEDEEEEDNGPQASPLQRVASLRTVSISLICGAQNLATSVTKSLFRSRHRKFDAQNGDTQLDLMKRPPLATTQTSDFFTAIRENDPTSSFCRQKAATFEDLLSSDAKRREKFYMTRVCDPTSYFYKYHFDATHQRQPKKIPVKLVNVNWLKAHEHVVSWDRVDGLRRATVQWDAYLEPLLVDINTGAILDGHHRYHVGKQLGLEAVPCVLVDYLGDDSITVDVWPNCGRDSLTKQQVIDMSLSDDVFPPKTSRHTFSDDLPPISVPLAKLRAPITANYCDL